MLTSIEQLEKEIEKFHETVSQSTELVRLIKSAAAAVTNQTDVFSRQSDSWEKAINRVPEDIKSDYNEMLKRFAGEKNSYAEVLENSSQAFSACVSKLRQEISAFPEKNAEANSELIEKASVKLREINSRHQESLEKLKEGFAGEIATYRDYLSGLQGEIKATGKK